MFHDSVLTSQGGTGQFSFRKNNFRGSIIKKYDLKSTIETLKNHDGDLAKALPELGHISLRQFVIDLNKQGMDFLNEDDRPKAIYSLKMAEKIVTQIQSPEMMYETPKK